MAQEIKIKKSDNFTMFVPAFVDDYGFTPEEFRVLSRIMRRALGNDRDCFESVPEMAQSLKIGVNLLRQILHVLESCNAITRTGRAGKSDLLDFNSCDKWKPSNQLPIIRASFDAERKRKDRERQNRFKNKQVVTDNAGVLVTDNAGVLVTDNAGVLVTDNADEGTGYKYPYPNEGEEASSPPPNRFADEAHNTCAFFGDEPDERLRFFPMLERSGLQIETLNELAELFTYIAEQEGRRTLIGERDWLDQCKKLFDEGMSSGGIKSLYRFCKEVEKIKIVTPKVMDWKFAAYKQFAERKGVALAK